MSGVTNFTGLDLRYPEVAAEHGVGAVGTAFAPRTYRWRENGDIVTEIQVDLTGLACAGATAGDAIGLAAGGAAYIGRYTTAKNGILYRCEMIVPETPTQATATITLDIDLVASASGTVAYDGAAASATILDTGGIAAGDVYTNNSSPITANHYLYLAEGDTAGATGVYSGGQVIIRLYGREVLS